METLIFNMGQMISVTWRHPKYSEVLKLMYSILCNCKYRNLNTKKYSHLHFISLLLAHFYEFLHLWMFCLNDKSFFVRKEIGSSRFCNFLSTNINNVTNIEYTIGCIVITADTPSFRVLGSSL